MSPKFVDPKEKQQHIARAALKLFALKGFAATSVEQIATAAGVGKGTLYEYFETKTDIFVAAIVEWMKQFENTIMAELAHIEDPLTRLKTFVAVSTALVDPIDPLTARFSIEILQHTLIEDGALYERRHVMKDVHTGMRKILESILLDGISKGVFRPEWARDAEKFAINLLGYIAGISLHYLMSQNYFHIREQVAFTLQNVIGMLRSKPGDPWGPADIDNDRLTVEIKN